MNDLLQNLCINSTDMLIKMKRCDIISHSDTLNVLKNGIAPDRVQRFIFVDKTNLNKLVHWEGEGMSAVKSGRTQATVLALESIQSGC